MKWHRSLCITAAAVAAIAGPALTAGTASADSVTTLDPAITFGDGAFPCAGYVRAVYDPAREFYGRQVVWMRAEFTFLPVPSNVCAVNTTLTWRNIDTGETGGSPYPVPLGDGRLFGPKDALWVPFDLGRHPGHYQVLIGTDLPHIAGHAEITVPR